jgi:16S rRNA processing protein RimM
LRPPKRAPSPGTAAPAVVLGKIAGLFGVRGWVKVFSHTRPREAILTYRPWRLCLNGAWQEFNVAEGHVQGKGVVARFDGISDRNQAAELVGAEIAVARELLPRQKPGEYYWADLEGLTVVNRDGEVLGEVAHLFETGANDVMVVRHGKQERLLPFTKGTIERVDLEHRKIHVDWDKDF